MPSVSQRLEARLAQWEHFARLLPQNERDAFNRLVAVVKNRRSAIDASDEADVTIGMLLAIVTSLQAQLDAKRRPEGLLARGGGWVDAQGGGVSPGESSDGLART